VTSDPKRYPCQPTWASTNLGVVFCIRCSGVHRKIGAHITKVLSLQIDSWSDAQLQHMETLGNSAVNAQLEASLPEGLKPDAATCTNQQLESYLRAKYELGSFKAGGDGRLPEVAETLESDAAAKAAEEFVGLLIIRLLRGTDLPNMDLVGRTDAYATFLLGDRKCRSKAVRNSLNPVWNETLSLNVRSLKESLILKLYDEDRFGADTFIGQALLPLEDLTHDGQPMGFDLSLQQISAPRRGGGGERASVAVEITYNPLNR